jgi:hypothetical protein
VIFAVLIAAASPTAAPGTDYSAAIHAGKLLCSTPDTVAKTCSNIDRFALAADGTLTDTGESLLAPVPLVTLETSSIVHVDGATNCGMLELADLQKGIVRVNGEMLPPDRNALAIGKIVEKMGSLAGHKACESLHVDGGKLIKSAVMEGVDIKVPDLPVAWIAPEDGYKVAGSPPVPPTAPETPKP